MYDRSRCYVWGPRRRRRREERKRREKERKKKKKKKKEPRMRAHTRDALSPFSRRRLWVGYMQIGASEEKAEAFGRALVRSSGY